MLSEEVNDDDAQQSSLQLNFFNNQKDDDYQKLTVFLKGNPVPISVKNKIFVMKPGSGACDCACE
jgi:hypothetical protein